MVVNWGAGMPGDGMRSSLHRLVSYGGRAENVPGTARLTNHKVVMEG